MADMDRMQQAVRSLLQGLGEDVEREGLVDTPKRVAKALLDCTSGYTLTTASTLGTALFHEPTVHRGNEGVVLVRDIHFASTSERNLMPFHGACHVAYQPRGGVVLGLSKLARLAKQFAKRLQTQERLAAEIALALQTSLECPGVAVVLRARHLGPADPPAHGACEPQLEQPPQRVVACVAGCFQGPDSPYLQELAAVLGLEEELLTPASYASAVRSLDELRQAITLAGSDAVARRLTRCPAGADLASSSPASPCAPSVGSSYPSDSSEDGGSSRNTSDGGSACDDTAAATVKDKQPPGQALQGPVRTAAMEAAVRQLLVEVGEDPQRPGLEHTARNYVASLLAATAGYGQELPRVLPEAAVAPGTVSPAPVSPAPSAPAPASAGSLPGVVALHVPFASQCEHHMLPFYGRVMVAYLPPAAAPAPGPGPGPRLLLPVAAVEGVVAVFTRRLQVQERITHQVADAVADLLGQLAGGGAGGAGGRSVMVVCDAAHMCMVARGVENHCGSTTSWATRGAFAEEPAVRAAVLRMFRGAA